MKMSKILLVFMIGLISLNVIFAGTTSKTFLIKGDLAINPNLTTRCGLGSNWDDSLEVVDDTQIDQTGGGQGFSKAKVSDTLYFSSAPNSRCKLEIYTPNNPTTPIYSKSNLNANAIKYGLNNGIVIGPVTITSTDQTINFIVKIKGQNTSNQYTEELLTTTIKVPNPNSEDTVVAADTADTAVVSQKSVGLINTTTTDNVCNADSYSSVSVLNGVLVKCDREPAEGGVYWYYWSPISSGGGTQYITTFNELLMKFSYADFDFFTSLAVQRITLNPITFDDLDQDLRDYIDSKGVIAIADDSITYDNLDPVLKDRIGDVLVDSSAALGQNPEPNKYYVVRDSVNGVSYYIPVYVNANYGAYAYRNLITTNIFDSTKERTTGSDYSNSYPPTSLNQKYSDFEFVPTNRKYFSSIKYKPIDISITDGGNNQTYQITIKRCSGNDPDSEEAGNVPLNSGWDCENVPATDLRGDTIDTTLANPFTASTNSYGNLDKKIHVKLTSSKKAVAVVFQVNGQPATKKGRQAAEVVHLYAPITNISIYDEDCKFKNVGTATNPTYRYTMSVTLKTTGGSTSSQSGGNVDRYFKWCSKAHTAINEDYTCNPGVVDNASHTAGHIFYNTTGGQNAMINVTIHDTRTGQRFSQRLQVNCTESS